MLHEKSTKRMGQFMDQRIYLREIGSAILADIDQTYPTSTPNHNACIRVPT